METQINETETDLAKLKKDVETVRTFRQANERQAIINIAFLYGIQHFDLDRKAAVGTEDRIVWELKNIERKKKQLRTANYILPLFRSMFSKFVMMKSTVEIEPTTITQRDKDTARISNEVAEDFWDTVNKNNPSAIAKREVGMRMINAKRVKYMMATGHGYLIPHFNPNTLSTAFLNGESVNSEIGEVEVKVKSLFDVFVDRYNRWFVYRERMPVDMIEEQYGVIVEPESEDMETAENRLSRMLNDGADAFEDKEAATVYTRYQIKSKKYPNGRMVVYTVSKILSDGDLPDEYKGRLPLFDFRYLDFLFSPYAQGFVDQLISLQEEYNFTLSRIASYKKFLTGKVMNPKGSKLSSKYDDEVGQILTYEQGFKPSYEAGSSVPSYLFEDLSRIRKDMEDISCVHDSSMGRNTAGVKSGVAMENLKDFDDTQAGPEIMTDEQQLGLFVEMCLDIMAVKYTEPRILSIAGENLAVEVNSFKGADLIGNRRVKVSLGSIMPTSKSARQEFITKMLGLGVIDVNKAKELLEFGDVDGIWYSLDRQAARQENINLIRFSNEEIVAEPWEDHTTHLKVHQDFMKSSQFEKLPPEVRQKFIVHTGEHQQMLLAESQAAGSMGGAAPTPGQAQTAANNQGAS